MHALHNASQLARQAPQLVPKLAVSLCKMFKFKAHCDEEYGLHSQGPIIAQLLAYANTSGYDGQYICFNFFHKSQCDLPSPVPLNLTKYFGPRTTKSVTSAEDQPKCSLEQKRRLKVLHFSDFHLDIRYATGSEANCSRTSMCCRVPVKRSEDSLNERPTFSVPAPRFGYFQW